MTHRLISEELFDIPGYEGLYAITKSGKVWSYNKKYVSAGWLKTEHKNYERVSFYKNKKNARLSVHRILAELFILNPDNKPQINHINGIKTDNRLSNLEWVTNKENHIHALGCGLLKNCWPKGEKSGTAKLTEREALEIRSIPKSISSQEIAKKYGISRTGINAIRLGYTWKHLIPATKSTTLLETLKEVVK